MSALGGNPDGICSLRAFPLLTRLGHSTINFAVLHSAACSRDGVGISSFAAARLSGLSVLFHTRKRALIIGDIKVFVRRGVCVATFKLGAQPQSVPETFQVE